MVKQTICQRAAIQKDALDSDAQCVQFRSRVHDTAPPRAQTSPGPGGFGWISARLRLGCCLNGGTTANAMETGIMLDVASWASTLFIILASQSQESTSATSWQVSEDAKASIVYFSRHTVVVAFGMTLLRMLCCKGASFGSAGLNLHRSLAWKWN